MMTQKPYQGDACAFLLRLLLSLIRSNRPKDKISLAFYGRKDLIGPHYKCFSGHVWQRRDKPLPYALQLQLVAEFHPFHADCTNAES